MNNEIYLANDLPEILERLSKDQRARVTRTIDSLADDPTGESYVIAGDNSPGGGLRAIHTGGMRILFRFAPEIKSVIVTDVSSMAEQGHLASA